MDTASFMHQTKSIGIVRAVGKEQVELVIRLLKVAAKDVRAAPQEGKSAADDDQNEGQAPQMHSRGAGQVEESDRSAACMQEIRLASTARTEKWR
jgi:hypothetical protein